MARRCGSSRAYRAGDVDGLAYDPLTQQVFALMRAGAPTSQSTRCAIAWSRASPSAARPGTRSTMRSGITSSSRYRPVISSRRSSRERCVMAFYELPGCCVRTASRSTQRAVRSSLRVRSMPRSSNSISLPIGRRPGEYRAGATSSHRSGLGSAVRGHRDRCRQRVRSAAGRFAKIGQRWFAPARTSWASTQ